MSLTKKNFLAMAEIMAHCDADDTLINTLSTYFETQNPSYDHDRFLAHIIDTRREMKENI